MRPCDIMQAVSNDAQGHFDNWQRVLMYQQSFFGVKKMSGHLQTTLDSSQAVLDNPYVLQVEFQIKQ